MKLKVLPLGNDHRYFIEEMNDCANEGEFFYQSKYLIPPIFNRDGWYLQIDKNSKKCWFEIDGLAFTSSTESFEHRLKCLDSKILSAKEFKILKGLVSSKLLSKSSTKEAKDKLYMHHHLCEMQDIRRS